LLQVLINNAGITGEVWPDSKKFGEVTPEAFNTTFKVRSELSGMRVSPPS
jgi:NAD(P)-dependent dehydrogenase (short-subunit alcohol dehydrogenase family)